MIYLYTANRSLCYSIYSIYRHWPSAPLFSLRKIKPALAAS